MLANVGQLSKNESKCNHCYKIDNNSRGAKVVSLHPLFFETKFLSYSDHSNEETIFSRVLFEIYKISQNILRIMIQFIVLFAFGALLYRFPRESCKFKGQKDDLLVGVFILF